MVFASTLPPVPFSKASTSTSARPYSSPVATPTSYLVVFPGTIKLAVVAYLCPASVATTTPFGTRTGLRSEERRVGKECRRRRAPDHQQVMSVARASFVDWLGA